MCCSSAIRVPKIWHTSSRRHQSLSVRDSLETSQLPTIPTSPNATALNTFEPLLARGGDAGAASEITIYILLLFPTQVPPSLRQVILKALTLLVLPHLFVAGLP